MYKQTIPPRQSKEDFYGSSMILVAYPMSLDQVKKKPVNKKPYKVKICEDKAINNKRYNLRNKSRMLARGIKKDVNMCEQCGSTSHLEVHHKNRNPLDNDKSNLIKICLSCHYDEHKHESIGAIMLKKLNYKLSLAA